MGLCMSIKFRVNILYLIFDNIIINGFCNFSIFCQMIGKSKIMNFYVCNYIKYIKKTFMNNLWYSDHMVLLSTQTNSCLLSLKNLMTIPLAVQIVIAEWNYKKYEKKKNAAL